MRTEEIEIINAIYDRLQKHAYKMDIGERCNLQKLLNKAIRMNDANRYLDETDERNFQHHIRQFEADIFLIESNLKQKILLQAATIQIALNRISEECKGGS